MKEAKVGDEIVVRGRRVGAPDARGEIRRILGENRFLVRWSDGRESAVVPGSDATIEHGAAGDELSRDLALTVDLRIHHGPGWCNAEAVMHTASAVLRGHGEARRHPDDADLPLVGEELAVARALADLAGILERAASEAIATGRVPAMHLVG